MNKFTINEIDFLKINYIRLGRKNCSIALNRSKNSIKDKCRRLGIRNSVKEIRLKQSMGAKKKAGQYVVNEDFFMKNHTPESVYLLGFLWADGHIHKGTRNSGNDFYQIVLGINTEDGRYLSTLLDKSGKWSKCYQIQKTGKPMTYFSCSNTILGKFLEEKDYIIKSSSSPIKILEYIPNNLRRFFFLGYLDGDGCIYTNKRNHHCISFSSSFGQDWKFLKNLCDNIGCSYSSANGIRKDRNSKFSYFSINGKNNFILFGKNLYDDCSLGLLRKRNKFLIVKNLTTRKDSLMVS